MPGDVLITDEDLLTAAHVCAEALRPLLGRDWSVRAAELETSCEETCEHISAALGSYSVHLASRSPVPLPFRLHAVPREGEAGPPALVVGMESMARVLALVAGSSAPQTRAFHVFGLADAEGFRAMGCDEMLIHTDDIVRGLGGRDFRPPDDLCRKVVRRLFPWSPGGADAWSTLRWANGRQALPGHPRLAPDWVWHAAPVEEWNGQLPPGVT
jgi:hypothetical protein